MCCQGFLHQTISLLQDVTAELCWHFDELEGEFMVHNPVIVQKNYKHAPSHAPHLNTNYSTEYCCLVSGSSTFPAPASSFTPKTGHFDAFSPNWVHRKEQ